MDRMEILIFKYLTTGIITIDDFMMNLPRPMSYNVMMVR